MQRVPEAPPPEGLYNGKPPSRLRPWQWKKDVDLGLHYYPPAPHLPQIYRTYCQSLASLPPVRLMSRGPNPYWLNGVEAEYGIAEQLFPERPRDKSPSSAPHQYSCISYSALFLPVPLFSFPKGFSGFLPPSLACLLSLSILLEGYLCCDSQCSLLGCVAEWCLTPVQPLLLSRMVFIYLQPSGAKPFLVRLRSADFEIKQHHSTLVSTEALLELSQKGMALHCLVLSCTPALKWIMCFYGVVKLQG